MGARMTIPVDQRRLIKLNAPSSVSSLGDSNLEAACADYRELLPTLTLGDLLDLYDCAQNATMLGYVRLAYVGTGAIPALSMYYSDTRQLPMLLKRWVNGEIDE